jgi:hypothetical protein
VLRTVAEALDQIVLQSLFGPHCKLRAAVTPARRGQGKQASEEGAEESAASRNRRSSRRSSRISRARRRSKGIPAADVGVAAVGSG